MRSLVVLFFCIYFACGCATGVNNKQVNLLNDDPVITAAAIFYKNKNTINHNALLALFGYSSQYVQAMNFTSYKIFKKKMYYLVDTAVKTKKLSPNYEWAPDENIVLAYKTFIDKFILLQQHKGVKMDSQQFKRSYSDSVTRFVNKVLNLVYSRDVTQAPVLKEE